MQAQKMPARRRRLARPLAVALAVAASCNAWADEPSPYYLGINQSLTHDSNIYNSVNGGSDYYSTTGLTGGFDQPIGRQRLYANANVRYNKYRRVDTLDNTSYGVAAGWDWATIEKLSGNVTANATQGLATQGGNGVVPPTDERNIVKTDQIGTVVRWGGAGTLSAEGSYAHSRVKYSAQSYMTSESSGDVAAAALHYRLVPDIRVGGGVRFSRTKSPFAVFVAPAGPQATDPRLNPDNYTSNTADGRNIDLTVDWTVTPQTGFNARLSWTHQSNSVSDGLDFSGITGAFSARYAPTAKLNFTASYARDAGTNATFFNVPPTTTTTGASGQSPLGLAQNSQTTDAFTLGVAYAATAKISVTASTAYAHARLATNVVGGTDTSDDAYSYALGVDYAIARNWGLGCKVSRQSRTVSGASSYSYGGNTIGCTAQFTLR